MLAAPLLNILDVIPFIIDIFGLSSTGKTTTGNFVISIFGDSVILKTSWNAIMVGGEEYTAFPKDLPVFLDDASTTDAKKRIVAILYRLANKIAKERSFISGGTQITRSPRSVIVSTTEVQLIQN